MPKGHFIYNKGMLQAYDEEAVRMIENMPKGSAVELSMKVHRDEELRRKFYAMINEAIIIFPWLKNTSMAICIFKELEGYVEQTFTPYGVFKFAKSQQNLKENEIQLFMHQAAKRILAWLSNDIKCEIKDPIRISKFKELCSIVAYEN